MSKIIRVEVFQADLKPHVQRGDAIQSFHTQETPMVRLFDDDGAEGVGYTYTIGTGGSSVVALIRDHLGPQPARPRSGHGRADLEGLVLPHACNGRRRDHQPGLVRDRFGAVGHALQKGRVAAARDGGGRAEKSPDLRYRGRLAAFSGRTSRRKCTDQQGARFSRREDQGGQAARQRRRETPCSGAQGDRRRDGAHGGCQPGFYHCGGDSPRAAFRAVRPGVVRGAAAGRRPERSCVAPAVDQPADRGGRVDLFHQPFPGNTCSAAPAPSCRPTWPASAASRPG